MHHLTTRVTMAYLQGGNVSCMAWSAVPRSNPTKMSGPFVQRELRQTPQAQNSEERFIVTLKDIWIGIDLDSFTACLFRTFRNNHLFRILNISSQFNHLIFVVRLFILVIQQIQSATFRISKKYHLRNNLDS